MMHSSEHFVLALAVGSASEDCEIALGALF